MGRRIDWEKIDAEIIRMSLDGASSRVIAERFGCSDVTIRVHLRALHDQGAFEPRPRSHDWRPEEIAKMIELGGQDLTAGEIADELGLPESCVQAKLYRLRKAGELPMVGRGRRKRKPVESEDLSELMARFSAACERIKEACGHGR